MKKNYLTKKTLLSCLLLFFCVLGYGQFTSGNLVVSYNTATNNSGAHRTLYLQEYTTTGNPVGTALNTGRKVDDRRAGHEGQLSTSVANNCIVLAGRDVSEGTAFAAARNPGTFSVVRISKDKTIAYTNFTSTDGGYASFNGEGVRAVASVDGSSYYVATGGNNPIADKGTRIVTHGNVTSTTQHSILQNRNVNISGNDILTISQANPGALTINGVVTTLGTGGNGDGLVTALMFDVDNAIPGNDLLYIANRNSGILKYAKSISGSWDYVGSTNNVVENTSGFVSMCGRIEAGKPVLYAIKIDATTPSVNSWLYKVTDNAGRTVDWNSGGANNASHTLLLTSNTIEAQTFRGVTFTPTSTSIDWIGITSSDFGDGANWQPSVAPASSDFVTIPAGTPYNPVISSNTTIAGATIAPGATLTINEGKVLTSSGTITNNGNLILKSGINGTASLLSNSTVANITQQRYLTSNQRGWRLLSNPLSDTTFGTLATNSTTPITLGANASGAYYSATNTWSSTDDTATMTSQQAFKVFVRGRTNEVTAADYGSVTNPANVTLAIKGTATNAVPNTRITIANQWYLVSNPYTAPVSVASILNASTGLSSSVAYYDPAKAGTDPRIKAGGYEAITIPNSAVAGSSDDVILPPLGAIFMQASSNGSINIPKTVIYTGNSTPRSNGQLFTNKITQNITPSNPSSTLKIAVNSANVNYDNLHLQFNEADVKSNIDFGKLPNTFLDLYSINSDQRKMAIAELELADQTIPLGITSTQLKNFTFNVVENSIPSGFEAVLVDKLTNSSMPLTAGANYNFSIDSNPASQGNKRFEINIKTKTTITPIENKLDPNLKIWPVPATDEFNISNNQAPNEGNSEISISNLSGQLMHTHQSSPGSTTTVRTNDWTPGIYILKATKNEKQTTTKIIIQ